VLIKPTIELDAFGLINGLAKEKICIFLKKNLRAACLKV